MSPLVAADDVGIVQVGLTVPRVMVEQREHRQADIVALDDHVLARRRVHHLRLEAEFGAAGDLQPDFLLLTVQRESIHRAHAVAVGEERKWQSLTLQLARFALSRELTRLAVHRAPVTTIGRPSRHVDRVPDLYGSVQAGLAGRRTWRANLACRPLFGRRSRTTDWLSGGVIKQHRTIGTTLNHLFRCGSVVTHVEDWGPTDEQITAHPDWAEARDRPMFLLIAAHR